jgi:hypothetical protein
MRRLNRTACALASASLVLGACGGGGGSGGETSPAPTQARSLASMTPPAGFDFASVRTTRRLLSTELTNMASAGQFPDPVQSYVSIWYLDNQAERQQLAFISLKSLQALGAQGGIQLKVPVGISTLSFELYDKTSSLTGELRL